MNTFKHKNALTFLVGIILIGIVLFTSENIFAQPEKGTTFRTPTKVEIANYTVGLNSDNEGVRKSCIYLAGKYKMTALVDILKEQLNDEKDAETSLLIVYALYQILEKGVISDKDSEQYFKVKYATKYE